MYFLIKQPLIYIFFIFIFFAQFEQKRVHIPSSVELYMKQYGVSKQEAYDELSKQVVKEWKDINQECLKPTPVPMPIITRVLNVTRLMNIFYKDEDEFGYVGKRMKDLIASFLIDPASMQVGRWFYLCYAMCAI